MLFRYLMTRTWMSVLSLLVAAPVAILTYVRLGHRILCTERTVREGANVDHACTLVGYSGVAALIALYVLSLARQRRRILAVLLLLEAATLSTAIGLVAADSATYVAHFPYYACFTDAVTEVHHVDALYAVCGVPLALLLLRAFGAWRGAERFDRPLPAEPDFSVPLSS